MSYQRHSILACAPTTQRGQAVHLSADPKNEKFLYTNGRTVIMRSLANPALADEYTEHTCTATVAKWAPSGYYIASGDVQGNIRIWDTVNQDHILKITHRPLSGRVNDIAWDSESKRLIVVGDGKERYGHAFTFDTANSCGEIIGHSKVANACHIRNNRPFRAVTCSDDMTVNFYQGPPYKFSKSINDHSRFVQSVRFSPDGQFFVSVGSDAKIFLFDGSTGDKVAELSEGAHTGGIFAVSWSPDSKTILTSSADMTCKLWDVAARKAVSTIEFSGTVDDQQVGNLWAGQHMLSLALSGDFHYLDARSSKPVQTLHGHQKGITAYVKRKDKTFFTGSYDGRVLSWADLTADPKTLDVEHASPKILSGKGHTNQVSALSNSDDLLVSVGLDDTVRSIDSKKLAYTDLALPTGVQPRAIASHGAVSVVATIKNIFAVKDGKKVGTEIPIVGIPTVVAISPDGSEVAVGTEDQKVLLYSLKGADLSAKTAVLTSNRGIISALAYSPNTASHHLAVGDTDRKVLVYDTATGEVVLNQWVFHTARVNCVAWTDCGKHAVSGGLDRNVYVWSVDNPMKSIAIKGAHQDGVTGVEFLNKDTVVSVGSDACVKVWSVKHHA